MPCSRQAMEEDRVTGTGPELGPPIRTSYGRELEPDLDDTGWSDGQLRWWVTIYYEHRRELRIKTHPANPYHCRWCDAWGNVCADMPEVKDRLSRYVRARNLEEGRDIS